MNKLKVTLKEITDTFKNADPAAVKYIEFHKYRYKYLLENIDEIINRSKPGKQIKLLDIGPAYQTLLIRKYFPTIKVDTLGFNHPSNNLKKDETHYNLNLNLADKEWNAAIKNYDIINFCEVIEHLYSQPEKCLNKLQGALADKGSIIIQTPNTVAIHKRLRMLIGQNPYNLLEANEMGHFREYTVKELQAFMKGVNLKTTKVSLKNYFNEGSTIFHRAFVRLEYLIPKAFRDGITIIATK